MAQEYWVLEGDWGGQVFLSVPRHLVPDEKKIAAALCIIDVLEWGCNEGDGASYFYFEGQPGDGLWGGMGGGLVTGDLWLHDGLLPSAKEWLRKFFIACTTDLPSPEEMVRWFIREDKWYRIDRKPARELWKKFYGVHRRAQKVLRGSHRLQRSPMGPLIAALMSGSDIDTPPESVN